MAEAGMNLTLRANPASVARHVVIICIEEALVPEERSEVLNRETEHLQDSRIFSRKRKRGEVENLVTVAPGVGVDLRRRQRGKKTRKRRGRNRALKILRRKLMNCWLKMKSEAREKTLR